MTAGGRAGAPAGGGALLRVAGLEKRFGGVAALDGVDLAVRPGEVHALLGENGAGKSTVIRCLSGVHAPDGGAMEWAGGAFRPAGPREAEAAGIAVVHQELSVVRGFGAAEMLHLGRPYPTRWGLVDRRAMRRRAREVMREVAPEVPLDVPMRALPPGQCQMVEIARALASGARLIVLDEPTAALGRGEADRLHALIARLAASGTAVLYVSHRLEDVLAHCDAMTVLRGGRTVAAGRLSGATREDLVAAMSGAAPERTRAAPRPRAAGEVLLALDAVPWGRGRAPLSLAVRAGEIVGLYGLVGAGRSGLLEAIWGARPWPGGRLALRGAPLGRGVGARVRAGMAFVPEERRADGLMERRSTLDNATLPRRELFRLRPRLPVPSRRRGAAFVSGLRERLAVRMGDPRRPIRELSGGNQQKVMVGRWTAGPVALWILDEPTRGVDVGAKARLHAEFRELAAGGAGILMASSDVEEAAELCDRLLVLHEGRVVAELPGRGATGTAEILSASFGPGAASGAPGRAGARRDGGVSP